MTRTLLLDACSWSLGSHRSSVALFVRTHAGSSSYQLYLMGISPAIIEQIFWAWYIHTDLQLSVLPCQQSAAKSPCSLSVVGFTCNIAINSSNSLLPLIILILSWCSAAKARELYLTNHQLSKPDQQRLEPNRPYINQHESIHIHW